MSVHKLSMLSEAARDAKEVAGLALDDAKEGFNFEGKVNAARAICDDVGFATRKVMSELDELLKKAYKSKILDIIRAHSGINFNRLARYTALALVIDRSIDRFIEKYHDFGSTDDDLRTFVSLNNHAAMIGDEVVAQLKEMEVSENLVDRAFTGAVDVFNDTESFSETGRRNPAYQIIRNGFGTATKVMLSVMSAVDEGLKANGDYNFIDAQSYQEILRKAYPFIVKLAMVTMRDITLLQRENVYFKIFRHTKLEKVGDQYKVSIDVEGILNELPQKERHEPYYDQNNFGCPALVNFGGGSAMKKFYDWFVASAGRARQLIMDESAEIEVSFDAFDAA